MLTASTIAALVTKRRLSILLPRTALVHGVVFLCQESRTLASLRGSIGIGGRRLTQIGKHGTRGLISSLSFECCQ